MKRNTPPVTLTIMIASAKRAFPTWLLDLLACPLCGQPLVLAGDHLVCDNRHTYPTRPRLDLLPPGKRPPNEGPGDTTEMARLRAEWERRLDGDAASSGERAALEHYLDTIAPRLYPGATVLDLGCGTGDVLRRLGARYAAPLALVGLDISTPMLDAAYRTLRHEPRAVVVRASARRRLPLRDGTVDVVLRRLAPALPDEVSRVLKPGGAYVTASFGPAHRRELYDALNALPRPKATREPALDALLGQGFAAAEHHAWRGVELVTPAEALDRLLMGPAAFHLDKDRDLPRLQALADESGGVLRLTTDVEVSVGIKGVVLLGGQV